ncbi:E3 ubiquitin-protein ligase MARCHF3 isoform X1 [Arvicanthis niloticus]|uniref:E3 ubiquitin-protein ligase MARCHF3 isoform X1 n=1 Tax=Arvicanthis niloticus TaxID=61156 RepID=UPI00402B99E9
MTTSRCSHLPEVLPDCTSSAAPVVKTVEDCGSLVNGQPQYVMQVSAKDGQLLSTVVRTLATQSPFNDRPMCRICHEGSSQEDLLSPCECTGTLGTIHRSCLEHWLSSSNTSYCELCHFRFAVERKPRPLVEWLRNPGPQHEKRTLFGDMVCFLFITPLATISGWLCLRGAVDHLHFSSRLEAVGLIALTVALFTIYLFWTLGGFQCSASTRGTVPTKAIVGKKLQIHNHRGASDQITSVTDACHNTPDHGHSVPHLTGIPNEFFHFLF